MTGLGLDDWPVELASDGRQFRSLRSLFRQAGTEADDWMLVVDPESGELEAYQGDKEAVHERVDALVADPTDGAQ